MPIKSDPRVGKDWGKRQDTGSSEEKNSLLIKTGCGCVIMHVWIDACSYLSVCVICAQERLDKTREALTNSRKQNHGLSERLQTLQRSQEESELRVSELDKQTRGLQEVKRTHTHSYSLQCILKG